MINLVIKGVTVRTYKESDKFNLTRVADNKNVWDNLRDSFPYPYHIQDAEEFIERCRKEEPQRTFAIEYEEKCIGSIGLVLQSDIYRKSAEIGYFIGEPYWGKGIASKAVEVVLKYGFEQLDLIRIFCGIFDFNKASMRVVEKCGFELESIARKAIIKNGKIHDEYRYVKLREEK